MWLDALAPTEVGAGTVVLSRWRLKVPVFRLPIPNCSLPATMKSWPLSVTPVGFANVTSLASTNVEGPPMIFCGVLPLNTSVLPAPPQP